MKKISTLFCCAFLLAGAACTRFAEPPPVKDTERENAPYLVRTRAAGTTFDSLPDPYFIENMQAIYDEFDGNIELEPTDLYVRIMPQDSLQMDVLLHDYNLDLFDYPLDLDIPNGEEYVDPTIPEGEPGWLYTTVKPDFVFPEDIIYDTLRACYIPTEENGVIEVPPTTRTEGFIIDVEREAYERLGYVLEPLTRASGDDKPEGRVTVYDNSGNDTVPVKKVRIKVRRHTKTDKVYTNDNGEYKITKSFPKGELNYILIFINEKDFVVRKDLAVRAKYDYGKRSKRGCDIHLTENSGEVWQWAAINNAAYDYYCMCDDTEISRSDGTLKIWCRPNRSWSSAPMLARIVHIGTEDANYRNIYNTVSHELAHTSHYAKAGYDNYWRHYIDYIIACWFNGESTYGNGTRNHAGIVEVGEMWGHAMGAILDCEKHNITRLDSVYYNTWHYWHGNRDDFFYRAGDVVNGSNWIQPDPIWALITRDVLTKKQVFDCLTSDVDTRAKLITKMRTTYPAKAPLIQLAFDINDTFNPAIDGPGSPILNTSTNTVAAEYTVPATDLPGAGLSDSVALASFTVSGTTADRTFTLTGGTLNVTFKTAGTFTVTATYDLPGGAAYTCTKTVNVGAETLPVPILDVRFVGLHPSLGRIMELYVTNVLPGAHYQWMINGSIMVQTSPIQRNVPSYPYYYSCRTVLNGQVSEWCEEVRM